MSEREWDCPRCYPKLCRGHDTQPENIMKNGVYHHRDGWTFERLPDASVRVVEGYNGRDILIPPAQWCSIVASVAPGGGSPEDYKNAQHAHQP